MRSNKRNCVNIYQRQMKKWGLTVKEYAKLLDVPYEIVKNIVYNKEGVYDKDMEEFLRSKTLDRFQEIEKNSNQTAIDVAKIKMSEENSDVNNEQIMYWYKNVYTKEILFKKTGVTSITQFRDTYKIVINNKEAGQWYTYLCLTKNFYKEYSLEIVQQYATQLYDIVVNNNAKKYLKQGKKIKKSIKKPAENSNKILNVEESSTKAKCDAQIYNEKNIINEIIIKRLSDQEKELIRQIAIKCLTDEEKALIKMFGGKID